MTLFLKHYDIIAKVNQEIYVVPSGNNNFLPVKNKYYVLLVDNKIEIGHYKTKNDAVKVLDEIFDLIKTSQFSVTNTLIYEVI